MRCEIFATEMKQNPESSSQSRSGEEIIKAGAEDGKMYICIRRADCEYIKHSKLSLLLCLIYLNAGVDL